MPTATFYPDVDPESTSVDGWVERIVSPGSESWSALRAGAGTVANDDQTNFYPGLFVTATEDDPVTWVQLIRGILLFDTSSLPDGANITSAVLSIYGFSKSNTVGASPTLVVVAANPASNTALVVADYSTLGVTKLSDEITYSAYAIEAYNDFTLNAAGIALISKTGITKFGTREAAYDLTGVAPPQPGSGNRGAHFRAYAAETSAKRPKLVVTYTAPVPTVVTDPARDITSTSATLVGDITNTGGEDNDERGFEWDEVPGLPMSDSWTETGTFSTGEFTHGISGLDADKDYYFRAKSHNSAGWGYGVIRKISTAGPIAQPEEGTTRVTGLVYRSSPGVYTLEELLGGVSSEFFIPISKEPSPTIPPDEPLPSEVLPGYPAPTTGWTGPYWDEELQQFYLIDPDGNRVRVTYIGPQPQ